MSPSPACSVIVATHNPNPARLRRTIAGLQLQTLPPDQWELVMVDNASKPAVDLRAIDPDTPGNLRIVSEPELGLTAARRRGLIETRAALIVMVDDDNVLAPDYLQRVIRIFEQQPHIGAIGGKSLPEFKSPPPAWADEFFPLLALRDLGDQPQIARGLRPPGATRNAFPAPAAPIGAGMAIRREAIQAWLDRDETDSPSDRRGAELTSGGDNDIVFSILSQGWEVGYFPELVLTHLIPAARLGPDYLARLNRGIQESWMRVLAKWDASPWPPIARWTVPFRTAKAWFTCRAWTSPAARIRWHGARGHFEGRVPACEHRNSTVKGNPQCNRTMSS